jgi:hypothetical protein
MLDWSLSFYIHLIIWIKAYGGPALKDCCKSFFYKYLNYYIFSRLYFFAGFLIICNKFALHAQ